MAVALGNLYGQGGKKGGKPPLNEPPKATCRVSRAKPREDSWASPGSARWAIGSANRLQIRIYYGISTNAKY